MTWLSFDIIMVGVVSSIRGLWEGRIRKVQEEAREEEQRRSSRRGRASGRSVNSGTPGNTWFWSRSFPKDKVLHTT